MSFKTEIVAIGVRYLAENTNLVRKPDAFEELISNIFTGETYDQRVARELVGKTDEVVSIAKTITSRLKTRKIQNG